MTIETNTQLKSASIHQQATPTTPPTNPPVPAQHANGAVQPLTGRITTARKPSLFLNLLGYIENIRRSETAATYNGVKIDYGSLAQISNQIAHYLVSKYTIKKNSRVGIIGTSKLEMLLCELAVLKAGGAFIPFDSNTPKERLEFTLENAQPDLMIICDENVKTKTFSCETFSLKKEKHEIFIKTYKSAPETHASDKDLAYILYTSGSTAKQPKGVQQTRGGLLAQIQAYTQDLSITPNDHILQLATLTHDQAIVDSFAALLTGASLHLYSLSEKGLDHDREEIRKIILEENISIFSSIPSLFHIIFDGWQSVGVSALRIITVGGEAVEKEHAVFFQKFLAPQTTRKLEFINGYGASECSWIAYHTIKGKDNLDKYPQIPLGKITASMKAFIDQNASPDEGVGELLIASKGVSPGYWNNNEANEKAFTIIDGVRYYRTGDFVTQDANKIIHFRGRKAWHVKINGERINLGTVRDIMLEMLPIWDVKLIAHKSGLHAFIATDVPDHVKLQPESIHQLLKTKLRSYEIPSFYHLIEEFPVLPNGKVDRQKLLAMIPSVEIKEDENSSIENFIDTQIKKDLLLLTPPSEELNLYHCGYDSLKFTILAGKINNYLDKKIITGFELMTYPTLCAIKKIIRHRLKNFSVVDMPQRIFVQKGKVSEKMGHHLTLEDHQAIDWDFYHFNFNALKIIFQHFADKHQLQIFPTESENEFFGKIEELIASEEEGQFGLTFPILTDDYHAATDKNWVHYAPCILRKQGMKIDLFMADSVGVDKEKTLIDYTFPQKVTLHFDPFARQLDRYSCYIDLVLYFVNGLQLDMADDSIKLTEPKIQLSEGRGLFRYNFEYKPHVNYFLSPLEILKYAQNQNFLTLLTGEEKSRKLQLSEIKESVVDYLNRNTKVITFTKTQQDKGRSPEAIMVERNCSWYEKSREFSTILSQILSEKSAN